MTELDHNIFRLLSQRAFLGRYQHNDYLTNIPQGLHRIACVSEDEHSILGSQRQPGGVPPFACGFGKTSDTQHMLATADEDGHVCLYDTHGVSKLAKEWEAHNNAIFDLKWADTEPWVLTASGDQTAALWDVKRGCRLAVFKQHSSSLKSVSFRHGDHNVFATGARDGRIMVWDIRCNHKEGPPSYHTPVNTIADGHVPVRPSTPKPAKRQRLTPTGNSTKSSVTAVVFNDEFSLISAGATESTIKVWDIRTIYKGSSRKPVPKHEYPYCGTSSRNIGFSSVILNSSRSRVYASCTDDVIYAFDCLGVHRYPVACYMGHSNSSFYVKSALSSDNTFLLSGSSDHNAYIWKVNNPSHDPVQLTGHSAEVTSVAWSPLDFPKLVTCADDNSVRVWRLHNQSEEKLAKDDENIVGRAIQEKPKQRTHSSSSGFLSPLMSPRPPSRCGSTSPFTTLQPSKSELKKVTPIKKEISIKTFFAKKRLASSEPNNNSSAEVTLHKDEGPQNKRTKEDDRKDESNNKLTVSEHGSNVSNEDKENEPLCQRLPDSPPRVPLSPKKSINPVSRRATDKELSSSNNNKVAANIPDSCHNNQRTISENAHQRTTSENADTSDGIKKLSWPNSVDFDIHRKPSNPCQGCKVTSSPPAKPKPTGKITGYFKRLSKDKNPLDDGGTPS